MIYLSNIRYRVALGQGRAILGLDSSDLGPDGREEGFSM